MRSTRTVLASLFVSGLAILGCHRSQALSGAAYQDSVMAANRVRRPRPPKDTSAARVESSRESTWAHVDTSRIWFQEIRTLDLTGEGRPDQLVLRAKGNRGDSLVIRLLAVVARDTFALEDWRSDYELVDPPFPMDTAQGVIDAYVRKHLRITIDSAYTERARLELSDLTGPDDGCGEGSDGCVLQYLNGDTATYLALRKEFQTFRPVRLSYNYGYESSIEVAWSPKLRRFVVVFACC